MGLKIGRRDGKSSRMSWGRLHFLYYVLFILWSYAPQSASAVITTVDGREESNENTRCVIKACLPIWGWNVYLQTNLTRPSQRVKLSLSIVHEWKCRAYCIKGGLRGNTSVKWQGLENTHQKQTTSSSSHGERECNFFSIPLAIVMIMIGLIIRIANEVNDETWEYSSIRNGELEVFTFPQWEQHWLRSQYEAFLRNGFTHHLSAHGNTN